MPVRMLSPGIYDKDGELHIIAPELAAHWGVPLDWLKENIEEMVRAAFAESFGDDMPFEYEETTVPPAWRGRG